MYIQLPSRLKCTFCAKEGLRLAAGAETEIRNGVERVLKGAVDCPRCRSSYPIQDGILNFLPVKTPNIGLGQWTNHHWLTAWGYERFWRKGALTKLGGRRWPPEEELASIIRMLQPAEPDRLPVYNGVTYWLDQGCSTGFYARAMAKAIQAGELAPPASSEGHVVAIDNAWEMLQEARDYIEQAGLTGRISLIRADIEQTPFMWNTFAGIANGGSLNEFRRTWRALSETYRVLGAAGRAAFMVQMHSQKRVGGFIQNAIHFLSGLHFFRQSDLETAYETAHFEIGQREASGLITISQLIPVSD